MTTIHITHRQDAYILAFVRAVAAAAGFRVQVPRHQLFTVAELNAIMDRLGQGGMP